MSPIGPRARTDVTRAPSRVATAVHVGSLRRGRRRTTAGVNVSSKSRVGVHCRHPDVEGRAPIDTTRETVSEGTLPQRRRTPMNTRTLLLLVDFMRSSAVGCGSSKSTSDGGPAGTAGTTGQAGAGAGTTGTAGRGGTTGTAGTRQHQPVGAGAQQEPLARRSLRPADADQDGGGHDGAGHRLRGHLHRDACGPRRSTCRTARRHGRRSSRSRPATTSSRSTRRRARRSGRTTSAARRSDERRRLRRTSIRSAS